MGTYRMDTTAFDTLAYGMPNMQTVDYIRQGLERVVQAVTPIGQAFMANAKALFDEAYGSAAMRKARAALGKVDTLFQPNTIMEYTRLAQFQNAGLIMQRYVMANPVVQKLYEEQRIDGWSSSYYHTEEGRLAEENYTYRRVMNGIMHEDAEGDECSIEWQETLHAEDRELTFEEQTIIIHTWDTAESIIRRGLEDLTSKEGGSM